jgi:hypothetical protein
MPEFQSRLCNVCRNTLDQAFSSIRIKESVKVPHHLTKDSLVDSVLVRGCHLCRLVVDFCKLRSASDSPDLEEDEGSILSQTVTAALSEEDFKSSEFEYANFPSDRLGIRWGVRGHPEDFGLTVQISEFGVYAGRVGLLEFDCASFARVSMVKPRFWIFSTEGIFCSPTTAEAAGIFLSNIVLSSIHRLSQPPWIRQDNCGNQLPKGGCRMVRSLQETPSCMH